GPGGSVAGTIINVEAAITTPTPSVSPPGASATGLAGRAPGRNRRKRGLLAALVAVSVLLAAGSGALFAWKARRGGPAPRAEAPLIAPADASTVDALFLPNKKAQALREMAEQYLDPAKKNVNYAAGFGICMDLGVFYLDNDRLDL